MRLVQKLIPELTLPLTTAPKKYSVGIVTQSLQRLKVSSCRNEATVCSLLFVCVAIEFSRKSRMYI